MFGKKKKDPVVVVAEKWVSKLRAMSPEEIVEQAEAVKRVDYVKGGGKRYYELVLHDTSATYVEVTTEGMMFVQHGKNYILFTLDAKKTKDVAEKLKKVEGVVG